MTTTTCAVQHFFDATTGEELSQRMVCSDIDAETFLDWATTATDAAPTHDPSEAAVDGVRTPGAPGNWFVTRDTAMYVSEVAPGVERVLSEIKCWPLIRLDGEIPLAPGQAVLRMGPTGSGKSTTLYNLRKAIGA